MAIRFDIRGPAAPTWHLWDGEKKLPASWGLDGFGLTNQARDLPTQTNPATASLSGPLGGAEASQRILQSAIRSFLAQGAETRGEPIRSYQFDGSHARPPSQIDTSCRKLVKAAREWLNQTKTAHRYDHSLDAIFIEPGNSPLGRYAARLAERGRQLAFDPNYLWSWSANAMNDNSARVSFMSIDAIFAGRPQAAEMHEEVHVESHARLNDRAEYSRYNGWLLPSSTDHGLFGTTDPKKAAYTNGFMLDELITSASDMEWDALPIHEAVLALAEKLPDDEVVQAHAKILRERIPDGDERYDLTEPRRLPKAIEPAEDVEDAVDRAVDGLAYHLDDRKRQTLPAKLREFTDGAAWLSDLEGATASFDFSSYFSDFMNPENPSRPVLKVQLDEDRYVEVTSFGLSGLPRNAGDLLVVDEKTGMRMTFSVVDPAAVAFINRATEQANAESAYQTLTGGPAYELDADTASTLKALVRDIVPARIDAFGQVAKEHDDGYQAVIGARHAVTERASERAHDIVALSKAVLDIADAGARDPDTVEPRANVPESPSTKFAALELPVSDDPWTQAVDRFDAVASLYPKSPIFSYMLDGSHPRPPEGMQKICTELVDAALGMLEEYGVPHTFHADLGSIEILPHDDTELGRVMDRAAARGERFFFDPAVPWSHGTEGYQDVWNRFTFLTLEAIEELAPGPRDTRSRFNGVMAHRFNSLGLYSRFQGTLHRQNPNHPILGDSEFKELVRFHHLGGLPLEIEARAFGLHDAAAAQDKHHQTRLAKRDPEGPRTADDQRLLPRPISTDDPAESLADGVAELKYALAELKPERLPLMITMLADKWAGALNGLASQAIDLGPSSYYIDFSSQEQPPPKRHVLRAGDGDVRFEVTTYPLTDTAESVAEVLIVDDQLGLYLDFPLYDAKVVNRISDILDASLQRGHVTRDDQGAMRAFLSEMVPARIDTFRETADTQLNAYRRLQDGLAGEPVDALAMSRALLDLADTAHERLETEPRERD